MPFIKVTSKEHEKHLVHEIQAHGLRRLLPHLFHKARHAWLPGTNEIPTRMTGNMATSRQIHFENVLTHRPKDHPTLIEDTKRARRR